MILRILFNISKTKLLQTYDQKHLKNILFNSIRSSQSESSKFVSYLSKCNLLSKQQKLKILNIKFANVAFSQRFHPTVSQPLMHPKISTDLYQKQLCHQKKKQVLIYDKPIQQPLHFGHFVNKIHKDIIARFLYLSGFKVKLQLAFLQKATSHSLSAINRWGLLASQPSQVSIINLNKIFKQLIKKQVIKIRTQTRLFDIQDKIQVDMKNVKIQSLKIVGQLIRFKAASFGQHQQEYKRLVDKNIRVDFLAFVDVPWHIYGTNYLSLNKRSNYAIIKKDNEFVFISTNFYFNRRQIFTSLGYQFVKKIPATYFKQFKALNPLTQRQIPIMFQQDLPMSYPPQRASGINCIVPAHKLKDEDLSDKSTCIYDFKCPLGNIDKKQTQLAIKAQLGKKHALFFQQKILQEQQLFFQKTTKRQLFFLPHQHLFLPKPCYEQEYIQAPNMQYPESVKYQKIIPGSLPREKRKARKFNTMLNKQNYPDFDVLQNQLNKKQGVTITMKGSGSNAIYFIKRNGQQKQLFYDQQLYNNTYKILQQKGLEYWNTISVQQILPSHLVSISMNIQKGNLSFSHNFSQLACFNINQISENAIVIQGAHQSSQFIINSYLLGQSLQKDLYQKAKLHSIVGNSEGAIGSENNNIRLQDIIQGPIKAIGIRQYGLGVDILRSWVIKKDGHAQLTFPTDQQLKQSATLIKQFRKTIRKLMQILDISTVLKQSQTKNQLLQVRLILYNLQLTKQLVNQCYSRMEYKKAMTVLQAFNHDFLWSFAFNLYNHCSCFQDLRSQQGSWATYILLQQFCAMLWPMLPHNMQSTNLKIKQFPTNRETSKYMEQNKQLMKFYSNLLLQVKQLTKNTARMVHAKIDQQIVNKLPKTIQKQRKKTSTFAYTLILNQKIFNKIAHPINQLSQILGVGNIQPSNHIRRMQIKQQQSRCIRCYGPGQGLCQNCKQKINIQNIDVKKID